MTEKSKSIFEDLGRPTLRGIRKCPKCGTYNGTRCLICKNTKCGQVFIISKDKSKEKIDEIEAVKIFCNTPNLNVYSVRQLDISEYRRCFVHLPTIEGLEALQDENEIKVIKQSAATCYATTCSKPLVDVCAITLNLNPCIHTNSILTCSSDSTPYVIKKMVVKVLPIPDVIKEEILSFESLDYLVQRISKNTFVVLCEIHVTNPCGFLHFSIYDPGKYSKRYRIMCECQCERTKPFVPKKQQLCIHYYLCICAIASDHKLLDEFGNLIQILLNEKNEGLSEPNSADDINVDATLQVDNMQIDNLMATELLTPPKKVKMNLAPNDQSYVFLDTDGHIVKIPSVKKEASAAIKFNAYLERDIPIPFINFEEWLATVTEQINQTMHYQFSGNPDPLVFRVPQAFFDVLQTRIAAGYKKKRLPNSVVTFTRKDALPLGVFSKYTYQITNVLHVKRIFDTPTVPLEVTRSFIANKDGTYTAFNPLEQKETQNLAGNFQKTENKQLIKPLELKTFLKVGTMSLKQTEPTPFIIEWIPDILPKTHVGEMKISFQFGHQKNGLHEKRLVTPGAAQNVENT